MGIKLQCYNLDFQGTLVPSNKEGIKSSLKDLFNLCVKDGVTDSGIIPSKALTYSQLLKVLREKKLIDFGEEKSEHSSSKLPEINEDNEHSDLHIEQQLKDSFREQVGDKVDRNLETHFLFIIGETANDNRVSC